LQNHKFKSTCCLPNIKLIRGYLKNTLRFFLRLCVIAGTLKKSRNDAGKGKAEAAQLYI